MRLYARVWLASAVVLGALGAAEALLAVPVLSVCTAAAATAALSGLSQLSYADRHGGSWTLRRSTLLAASVGGAVGAATTGLVTLLGGGAGALVVLAICVHPRVLGGVAGGVRRLLRLPGGVAAAAPRDRPAVIAPLPATGSTRPRDWASKIIPSLPSGGRGLDAAAVALLTLPELCWGWRASFTALQRADPRTDHRRWAALVTVRRLYLDEIARRDPAGFARWIYAGARPASDPTRYLLGSASTGQGARRSDRGAPRA